MGLFELSLKHLWRNKNKVIFLLWGIIIGVTTIVTLYTITFSMEKEISDKFDQIGSNMIIFPNSESLSLNYSGVTVQGETQKMVELSEDALDRIMSIKNSENIAVIAPKLLGTLETDGGKALAVGVDFAAEFMMKKWWKLEGKQPAVNNEVILGSNASSILNKKVGSKIVLGDTELVVSGILAEMGSEEDEALYLNLPLLQNLLNKEGSLSLIEVSALCYTCPIEDIVMQITNKLPEAKVTAVLEAVEARKVIVDKFSALARTVAIIVLFIGFLIVTNSFLAAINGRKKEIGILRSLGFKRIHVAIVIIFEGIVVSLFGGITGYLLGTLLAKWLAPLIAQMEVLITWDWKLGLVSLILAITVGIFASIIPVFRAVKQDPADSMGVI